MLTWIAFNRTGRFQDSLCGLRQTGGVRRLRRRRNHLRRRCPVTARAGAPDTSVRTHGGLFHRSPGSRTPNPCPCRRVGSTGLRDGARLRRYHRPRHVCGRPLQCKKEFEQLVTCGQVLSYVRPLECGMHAPRALMVFVDRIQIAPAVCLTALRVVLVFRPRLSDLLPLCCLSSQPHRPGSSTHHRLKQASAEPGIPIPNSPLLFQAAIPQQRQSPPVPGNIPS